MTSLKTISRAVVGDSGRALRRLNELCRGHTRYDKLAVACEAAVRLAPAVTWWSPSGA